MISFGDKEDQECKGFAYTAPTNNCVHETGFDWKYLAASITNGANDYQHFEEASHSLYVARV